MTNRDVGFGVSIGFDVIYALRKNNKTRYMIHYLSIKIDYSMCYMLILYVYNISYSLMLNEVSKGTIIIVVIVIISTGVAMYIASYEMTKISIAWIYPDYNSISGCPNGYMECNDNKKLTCFHNKLFICFLLSTVTIMALIVVCLFLFGMGLIVESMISECYEACTVADIEACTVADIEASTVADIE